MNVKSKRYILIVLAFMIVGTGCAFTLKSGIGVGAWMQWQNQYQI